MLETILVAMAISTSNPILEEPKIETPLIVKIEEQEQPKELSLEEKIKTNHYKCNTDTEYIRADTAECLAKPVQTPPKARKAVRSATVHGSQAPNGWFPYGQCTWLVSSRRAVGKWNNASSWYWQAQRDGWATGSTPRVGAIAWEPNHVSYVEKVNGDGTVTVLEMNYVKFGVISNRTASASNFLYIY